MSDGLSWVPQRAVFLRRSLWVVGATFAGLVIFGWAMSLYLGWPSIWVLPTALLLSIGFIFDDAVHWRAGQYDRWEIADGHLRHEGQDGTATIPLEDIAKVRTGYGGRVVLQLVSGQRIVMRYLPYPAQTAAQIDAARPA